MDSILIPIGIVAVCMLAVWGNWIFTAEDGHALPMKKRPGLIRFYFTLITNPMGALNSSAFW